MPSSGQAMNIQRLECPQDVDCNEHSQKKIKKFFFLNQTEDLGSESVTSSLSLPKSHVAQKMYPQLINMWTQFFNHIGNTGFPPLKCHKSSTESALKAQKCFIIENH